jgi:hypothetical protein
MVSQRFDKGKRHKSEGRNRNKKRTTNVARARTFTTPEKSRTDDNDAKGSDDDYVPSDDSSSGVKNDAKGRAYYDELASFHLTDDFLSCR